MICAKGIQHEPELNEHEGVLQLRLRPNTRCSEAQIVPLELSEAARPLVDTALATAIGRHRLMDPMFVLALAPQVDATFPQYGSKTDRWATAHPPSLSAALPGGWRIVEWLRGSLAYGQARCARAAHSAIATFTMRQTAAHDQSMRELRRDTAGVTPLLGIESFDEGAVMFEAEPAGVRVSMPMFPMLLDGALTLMAQLVAVARQAADAGVVIGTLRPELIYFARDSEGLVLTGVVPRVDRFRKGMVEPRDAGPTFPFDAVYGAPEGLRGEGLTNASDVFSICAVTLYMMSRRPPFDGGEGLFAQLAAILRGPPEMPSYLPPALAKVLRAGLVVEPKDRPRAGELASALAMLGYAGRTPAFVAR
jgi:hypothetical protein